MGLLSVHIEHDGNAGALAEFHFGAGRSRPGLRHLVFLTFGTGLGDNAADYSSARLTEHMLHSDYPLQAMLYTVVLHRFLRWRQPGYQPSEHLGGVLYLYVRGMCGPETPTENGHPCGVFSWRPPASMVVALSDLLDAG